MPRVNLDWQDDALCAQMPIDFLPDNYADSVLAQRVCQLCEVRAECGAYAEAHEERWGVWGGMSQDELRRRLADTDPDDELDDIEPDDHDEAAAA